MKRYSTIHVIPSLGQGGAETMLYKLLSRNKRTTQSIAVVSLLPAGYYSNKIKHLDFQVIHLDIRKKPIHSIIQYVKLCRSFNPDIIQSWMYHANIFSVILKPFIKSSRIVCNIRQSLANIQNNKKSTIFLIYLNARLSRFADAVINNSALSQVQHNKIGFKKEKDVLIPNGFNEKIFYPKSNRALVLQKLNIPEPSKVCGMFARYHHMKNQRGFLEVASLLAQNSKHDWFYILAGKGCNNSNIELMTLISQLGLTKKVKLLGQIETYDYYAALDVYLSASLEEGFPNVVGEAMFSGIIPVVTDVGECRALVANYGFVADSEDYNGLAQHCEEALSIPEHKKYEMVDFVRGKYSIQKVYEEYQDLYCQLMSKRVV